MENKQLNMEQRKVLKELFVTKLKQKEGEMVRGFEKERNDLRDKLDKKAATRKEVKEFIAAVEKAGNVINKLRKENLIIQEAGGYNVNFFSKAYKGAKIVSDFTHTKEWKTLQDQQGKKREEIEVLKQEIIADIYSLSLEYTAMVDMLNKKINKILA